MQSAARQRVSDQRQQLVPRVGPPRRAAEVEVTVDEFPQAQVPGRGWAGRSRPALATRRWSSKDDAESGRGLFCDSIYWVLLVSRRFSVPKPLSQIQRGTFLPFQEASHTPSFGGLGLRIQGHLTSSFISYHIHMSTTLRRPRNRA